MEIILGVAVCGLIIIAAFCTEAFQNVGPESPKWARVIAYSSLAITSLVVVSFVIFVAFIK